jgi:hypothetical protein
LAFAFSSFRIAILKLKVRIEALEPLLKERQILTFSIIQFFNWLPLNNQNLHPP